MVNNATTSTANTPTAIQPLKPKDMSLILLENGASTNVSFKNVKEANVYMYAKRIASELEWTAAWTFKLYNDNSIFEVVKSDGTKVKKMPTYQYLDL